MHRYMRRQWRATYGACPTICKRPWATQFTCPTTRASTLGHPCVQALSTHEGGHVTKLVGFSTSVAEVARVAEAHRASLGPVHFALIARKLEALVRWAWGILHWPSVEGRESNVQADLCSPAQCKPAQGACTWVDPALEQLLHSLPFPAAAPPPHTHPPNCCCASPHT